MTSYEHDPMYLLKLKNIQSCINSASEFIDQIIKHPEVSIDPKFSNLRSLLQDANSLIDNYSNNKKSSIEEGITPDDGQFLGFPKSTSVYPFNVPESGQNFPTTNCPNCGGIVRLNIAGATGTEIRCWDCGYLFKSP
ncbi:MAG: hypothetical protein WCG45_06055 [bacterium]